MTEKVREAVARESANFWLPAPGHDFQADLEEFQRLFGLRPELCDLLGTRMFLREDTLGTVN